MKKILITLIIFFFAMNSIRAEESLADYLQSISVTIKSGLSQGSGTIITREMKLSEDSDKVENVSFILTCGHVIDNLKSTRKIVDTKSGQERIVVEFKDASVCQFLIENGRQVGKIELTARPIRYSDADDGEDLAVLMLLKRNFTDKTARFYLEDSEPTLLTRIIHCGSFAGEFGHNSLSTGEISAVGRILETGQGAGKVFTQISNVAVPGSSGGLVVLEENGKYVGMLVRGVQSGFTFMVPMSRIQKWAKRVDVEWLLNPELTAPDLETILKQPVDDGAVRFYIEAVKAAQDEDEEGVVVENENKPNTGFLIHKE